MYYLAVAPEFFSTILDNLGQGWADLPRPSEDSPWSRVVIEKPFGHDLASAGR